MADDIPQLEAAARAARAALKNAPAAARFAEVSGEIATMRSDVKQPAQYAALLAEREQLIQQHYAPVKQAEAALAAARRTKRQAEIAAGAAQYAGLKRNEIERAIADNVAQRAALATQQMHLRAALALLEGGNGQGSVK